MPRYVAVIRKVLGTDYWIDIPDIPGCISRGPTIAAAKENFREALASHLELMPAGCSPLPTPRTLSELSEEDELEDCVEIYIFEL